MIDKTAGTAKDIASFLSRTAKRVKRSKVKDLLYEPIPDQSAAFKLSDDGLLDLWSHQTPAHVKRPDFRMSMSNIGEIATRDMTAQGPGYRPIITLNPKTNPLMTAIHELRHFDQHRYGNALKADNETRRLWNPVRREMERAGVEVRRGLPGDRIAQSETPIRDLPMEAHTAFFRGRWEPKWISRARFKEDAHYGLRQLERYAGLRRPAGLRPTSQFAILRQGRSISAMGQAAGHGYPVMPVKSDAAKLQAYLQDIYSDPTKMRRSIQGTVDDLVREYPRLLWLIGGPSAVGTAIAADRVWNRR